MAKKQEVESITVKQKRMDDCTKEVNVVLDKYGCTIDWCIVMTASGYRCDLKVVSK